LVTEGTISGTIDITSGDANMNLASGVVTYKNCEMKVLDIVALEKDNPFPLSQSELDKYSMDVKLNGSVQLEGDYRGKAIMGVLGTPSSGTLNHLATGSSRIEATDIEITILSSGETGLVTMDLDSNDSYTITGNWSYDGNITVRKNYGAIGTLDLTGTINSASVSFSLKPEIANITEIVYLTF
jgi:hypothetical protein